MACDSRKFISTTTSLIDATNDNVDWIITAAGVFEGVIVSSPSSTTQSSPRGIGMVGDGWTGSPRQGRTANGWLEERAAPFCRGRPPGGKRLQIPSPSHDASTAYQSPADGDTRPSSGVSWLGDESLSEWLAYSPKSSFSPLVASSRCVSPRDSVAAASPLGGSREQSPRLMGSPVTGSGSFHSQFSDGAAKTMKLGDAPASPLTNHPEEGSRCSGGRSSRTLRVDRPDISVNASFFRDVSQQPRLAESSHRYWEKVIRCLRITALLRMILVVALFGSYYNTSTRLAADMEERCLSSDSKASDGAAHLNDHRFLNFTFNTRERFTAVGMLLGFTLILGGTMVVRCFLRYKSRQFSLEAADLISRITTLLRRVEDSNSSKMRRTTGFVKKERPYEGAVIRGRPAQLSERVSRSGQHSSPLRVDLTTRRTDVPLGGTEGRVNLKMDHNGPPSDRTGKHVPCSAALLPDIVFASISPRQESASYVSDASTSPLTTYSFWLMGSVGGSSSASHNLKHSGASAEAFPLPAVCGTLGPLETNPEAEKDCSHPGLDLDGRNPGAASSPLEVTGQKGNLCVFSPLRSGMAPSASSGDQLLLLETFGSKHAVLGNSGFLAQQVTFLVCRLFLPAADLEATNAVVQGRLEIAQTMSRQFIEVVLRVAKEEYGVPFDIQLDSVVVTFHTPSGPNSVNLVRPRDCAFRLVSELQKLELRWARVSSFPFVWGIAMHLSQLLVGVIRTPLGRTPCLYGEEVRLAYRVTELCRVTDCPLLMLQPCYDVFRVCVTAVPVDVIHRRTCEGNIRIYLYEPKTPKERECVGSSREQYAPLIAAFGLMCEKKFAKAAEQFEKILELDHNVPRLHRLCQYFAEEEGSGRADTSLGDNAKYVREGPQWCTVDCEAQKFVQKKMGSSRVSAHNDSAPLSLQRCPLARLKELSNTRGVNKERSEVPDAVGNCASADLSHSTQFDCLFSTRRSAVPAFDQPGCNVAETTFLLGKREPAEGCDGAVGVCANTHQRCSSSHGLFPDRNSDSVRTIVVVTHPDGKNVERHNVYCDKVERLEFDIYGPVGVGSFGTVYRGLHPDGNTVAIKEYPVPSMDENNSEIQSTFSEIRMLSACRHKNIVRYIDRCFQDGCLYIITEFVSGGSLAALTSTFRGLPCDIIRRYTGDILRGLQYLHDRQIVHRDICPNNVLVSIDGVCKLSDFGGAVECAMQPPTPINDDSFDASVRNEVKSPTGKRTVVLPTEGDCCSTTSTTLKTCFGTPVCMAPEACMGVVDPKNDIWGLGITLCFCVACRYPWSEEVTTDARAFISKLRRGCIIPEPPFELMDAHFSDFVRLCLKREAKDRPTASELLFHDFMVS